MLMRLIGKVIMLKKYVYFDMFWFYVDVIDMKG